MAINVNTVYHNCVEYIKQRTAWLFNTYEFNQAATQVQLDIFENILMI
jgi:hypothetical protein